MIINLNQNPLARAIASTFLPTLMRGGMMFLLKNPSNASGGSADGDGHPSIEERWLMPKASLNFFVFFCLVCACAWHSSQQSH